MRRVVAGSVLALLGILVLGGFLGGFSVLVLRASWEEGRTLVVPVPAALAGAGLALAPRLQLSGVTPYHRDLGRVLAALEDSPDGVYLEAHGEVGEHVTVEKRDRALHVRVTDSPGVSVEFTLPLATLGALLRAFDLEVGAVAPRRLLPALRGVPRGPLLHLTEGDVEIQVGVWRPW